MKLPSKVIIQQNVEMLEAFTGFETKNKYIIYNENKEELFYAYEESNWFGRQFLGSMRALTLHIIDKDQKELMTIERQFAFFFPEHIIKKDNKVIGNIKRRFGFITRIFEINETTKIVSKLPHIWTFNILYQDQQVGQILKKWSGVGKEFFTDADTFMIDFGTVNKELKQLVLAAAFAIDCNLFERKKN